MKLLTFGQATEVEGKHRSILQGPQASRTSVQANRHVGIGDGSLADDRAAIGSGTSSYPVHVRRRNLDGYSGNEPVGEEILRRRVSQGLRWLGGATARRGQGGGEEKQSAKGTYQRSGVIRAAGFTQP